MIRSSSPTPSRTFMATLHPLAARFTFKPHLSDVTLSEHGIDTNLSCLPSISNVISLASILTGDTCAPISLFDFEKYLTFVDYRERYLKSFNEPAGSSSSEFVFEAPSYAKTEERAIESIAKLKKTRIEERTKNSNADFPASTNDAISSTSLSPVLPPVYVQLASPSLVFTPSKSHDPDPHGFHRECSRVIATFLTPGSPKELTLDAIVRDTVIRNLFYNCHPDVFLPVYEEVFSLLERSSLPRFLLAASANINLPKQLYWYTMGTLNMLLAILIALLLIMLVPTPPEVNRAWRILPVSIFVVGGGQFYSAWRGSCTQIWRRGATQVRVWEMQEMNTEAQVFVEGVLNQHKAFPESAIALQEKSQLGKTNISAIAPFAIEAQQIRVGRPSVSSDTIPSYATVPPVVEPPDHNFRRPPIFGPETVVLDPRIKAVHRQVVIDVHRFGVYLLLLSSAVVFPIPSRLHSPS
ncbi:hypothetical protein C0995_009135 [Termitomyces sp. Mi166|nr:hypothetical protein C0995_009135 [Termitomyces sp. Mi166\